MRDCTGRNGSWRWNKAKAPGARPFSNGTRKGASVFLCLEQCLISTGIAEKKWDCSCRERCMNKFGYDHVTSCAKNGWGSETAAELSRNFFGLKSEPPQKNSGQQPVQQRLCFVISDDSTHRLQSRFFAPSSCLLFSNVPSAAHRRGAVFEGLHWKERFLALEQGQGPWSAPVQ